MKAKCRLPAGSSLSYTIESQNFRADMKLFMIFAAVIAAMYRFKLRHSAKYSERAAKGKDRPAHLNGPLGGGKC